MGNNEGKTVIRLEPSSFHDVGAKNIWGGDFAFHYTLSEWNISSVWNVTKPF